MLLGWFVSEPLPGPGVETAAGGAAIEPVARPARTEFGLGADDVANDRETPALAADAQGNVVLAWAAKTGEAERTIRIARSTNGGKTFAPPVDFRRVPIYKFTSQGDKAITYSTHGIPRLTAAPAGLYLGWVEAVDGGPEVTFFTARSADGGKTFGPPVRVHGADASRPGFTTLSAAADGTLPGVLDRRPQPRPAALLYRQAGGLGGVRGRADRVRRAGR